MLSPALFIHIELTKFKAKFGHVNVAKSGDYVALGQFCGNQRYFNRRRLKGETTSLTDDRIQILSKMGFGWKVKNKDGASKVDISLKTKDGTHIVEKDKEIILPDGSTIDYATKESSQKQLVLLEDGSHVLETTTETYTTKIEKRAILPDEVQDAEDDIDMDTETPAVSGGMHVCNSENDVTYPDGSSVVCTTEESTKKSIRELDDKTLILEITTITCITKIERTRLPDEIEETPEMSSTDEPLGEE